MDYLRSAWKALGTLPRLRRQVGRLRERLREERPDLVVCDFEPTLPRAAALEGIRCASVDHQHFLTAFSSEGLASGLRWKIRMMGAFVRLLVPAQESTVVSAFYRPNLRRSAVGSVRQVGVLLGEDILQARPTDEGFLLVYLRRSSGETILGALRECDIPCRVYGVGDRGVEGNLDFRSVERSTFVRDLAGCRALVSTAGNQLVGEAIHLGKPVLALPEAGNWEQEVNGHWVERLGVGACVDSRLLSASHLRSFLGELPMYRKAMRSLPGSGNADVRTILEDLLPGGGTNGSARERARRGSRAIVEEVVR